MNQQWRKPSRCQNGECVEVAGLGPLVAVRDSNDPDGPRLVFGPGAWEAFVCGVKGSSSDGAA